MAGLSPLTLMERRCAVARSVHAGQRGGRVEHEKVAEEGRRDIEEKKEKYSRKVEEVTKNRRKNDKKEI